MDLSGEIYQRHEIERYLYRMDGMLQGVTKGKYISSTTIARKQHAMTRGTDLQSHRRMQTASETAVGLGRGI
jgi:hypothetical protein